MNPDCSASNPAPCQCAPQVLARPLPGHIATNSVCPKVRRPHPTPAPTFFCKPQPSSCTNNSMTLWLSFSSQIDSNSEALAPSPRQEPRTRVPKPVRASPAAVAGQRAVCWRGRRDRGRDSSRRDGAGRARRRQAGGQPGPAAAGRPGECGGAAAPRGDGGGARTGAQGCAVRTPSPSVPSQTLSTLYARARVSWNGDVRLPGLSVPLREMGAPRPCGRAGTLTQPCFGNCPGGTNLKLLSLSFPICALGTSTPWRWGWSGGQEGAPEFPP